MFKVGDEVFVKGSIVEIENDEYDACPVAVGFDKGRSEWYAEEELIPANKTYEQGLADAWALAKKIYDMKEDAIEKVFGITGMIGGFWNVVREMTPEEALAKIEAYEKEKEIKPTDIVEYDGKNWVVTEVYKGEYSIWNGKKVLHTANVKKVGSAESIEPLAELLRQIGE